MQNALQQNVGISMEFAKKLSIKIKKMHCFERIESAGQKHLSMFSFSSEFKMFD